MLHLFYMCPSVKYLTFYQLYARIRINLLKKTQSKALNTKNPGSFLKDEGYVRHDAQDFVKIPFVKIPLDFYKIMTKAQLRCKGG